MPVGGKDPDDVLREQGPAALKAQLADTKPFVEALFERDVAALSVAARRRAETRHGWDATFQGLTRIYGEMGTGASPAGPLAMSA